MFRRDLAWPGSCDVLVAEASGSSDGVGFEELKAFINRHLGVT